MDATNQTFFGQGVEVAAYRLRGNREVLDQLFDAGISLTAYKDDNGFLLLLLLLLLLLVHADSL